MCKWTHGNKGGIRIGEGYGGQLCRLVLAMNNSQNCLSSTKILHASLSDLSHYAPRLHHDIGI